MRFEHIQQPPPEVVRQAPVNKPKGPKIDLSAKFFQAGRNPLLAPVQDLLSRMTAGEERYALLNKYKENFITREFNFLKGIMGIMKADFVLTPSGGITMAGPKKTA